MSRRAPVPARPHPRRPPRRSIIRRAVRLPRLRHRSFLSLPGISSSSSSSPRSSAWPGVGERRRSWPCGAPKSGGAARQRSSLGGTGPGVARRSGGEARAAQLAGASAREMRGQRRRGCACGAARVAKRVVAGAAPGETSEARSADPRAPRSSRRDAGGSAARGRCATAPARRVSRNRPARANAKTSTPRAHISQRRASCHSCAS